MGGSELKYLREAFESNWIAPAGPHLSEFEERFSHKVGASYAVGLSSGTAAIHLGLRLLGIKPDDEVVCSNFTFIASANPILYQGAKPVFIDVDPLTWHIDLSLLADFLKKRSEKGKLPKALILPHIYGSCADVDDVCDMCNHFDIPVIEDAAESLGCTYGSKVPGTIGLIGAFSFNGNKIITTSSGGMLVSNDESLAQRARYLSSQARAVGHSFTHGDLGYNYRMSNILAAIGLGQLEVLEDRVQKKREIFQRYKDELSDLEGISFMPQPKYCKPTNWLSCVSIDSKLSDVLPHDIGAALEEDNVEVRFLWTPLHLQKHLEHYESVGGQEALKLFQSGLCLPSSTKITEDEQSYIITRIKQMWGK